MTNGARLPAVGRDDLAPDARDLYDTFVSGPRQQQSSFFAVTGADGVLSGPYRAMLLSPPIGGPMERLGRAIRFESRLPDRVREMAILSVAYLTESDVEWNAHEGLARESGVPDQTVDSLQGTQRLFLDDGDEFVHCLVRQLLVEHRLDDQTFAGAVQCWSREGVFELIGCVGYYQLIAHINNAFGLDAAAGSTR